MSMSFDFVERSFRVLDRIVESGRASAPLSRFRNSFLYGTLDNDVLGIPETADLADVDLLNTSIALFDEHNDQLYFCRFAVADVTSVRSWIHDKRAYLGRLFRYDVSGVVDGRFNGYSALFRIDHGRLQCVGAKANGRTSQESAAVRRLAETTFTTSALEVTTAVFSIDFARELCWTVSFEVPGIGASIGFLSDAVGVREALQARDVEPGAKRRSAIAHWVAAHGRKRRNDPEASTWVRRHLRGKWECSIFGMKATVGAPPDDLRRLTDVAVLKSPP